MSHWNMSTSLEPAIIVKRERCAVCDSRQLETAVELPELPLTGLFHRGPAANAVRGIDQELLICAACGHAQLAVQLSTVEVYDSSYSFRTSVSAVARHGTGFFLAALEEIAPGRHFNCALDIGCNDLYLLKQMKGRARARVGIDPLWASQTEQNDDQDITVSGASIEDVDLGSILETPPDIIVCRHTLEHIADPREALQKLIDAAAGDALFLFEVPSFEALVNRQRFDQIFHQHLQYFTLASFQRLIEQVGGAYITHRENYHDWGSLLVAFTKSDHRAGQRHKVTRQYDATTISERYPLFRRQLAATNDVLESFAGTVVYGYGAAQMLPILAYHLGNNLSLLTAVLDDDPVRDGWYYWNLPLAIRHTSRVESLKDASVFITAVDNVQPILGKLFDRRPRHIIYPFHII